jgi:hypothetical protein
MIIESRVESMVDLDEEVDLSMEFHKMSQEVLFLKESRSERFCKQFISLT